MNLGYYNSSRRARKIMLCLSAFLMLVQISPTADAQEASGDPPEITIGERLFLETRFAQFFQQFLSRGAGVNDPLPAGDPVMDKTVTIGEPLPGSFAGLSINCRACHLVDEHVETPGGTMRTYADFARRSSVPAREDGATTATRNSPSLVNATLPRSCGLLLHFDAEFVTTAGLIEDTFTGRNFGWLPGERALAIAHSRAETPGNRRGLGLTGVGMRRDVGVVRDGGSPAYVKALDDVVVAIMVEKRECVEDLDNILAVPGIDMVQFGGSDYSMSIGQTGKRGSVEVKAAERKTIETCLKLGIHPRIEISEPAEAESYIEMGVKHFCIGWDVRILHNFWTSRGATMQKLLGMEVAAPEAARDTYR